MSRIQLSRRRVLAGAVATALLLSLAFGQPDQEAKDMKVRTTFGDQILTANLYDNPSARDFYSMLPLELTIEDFARNEKIAHLLRKLTDEGSGPFSNEQPGDLCYYVPWGNLAMFYADYRHLGLIRLGRFEDYRPLLTRGAFPLRTERI